MVYEVNTSGVSAVSGSPFLPSPIPYNPESQTSQPVPSVTAVDPTGQYLYAVYNVGEFGAVVYSFNMINGVPHQLSISDPLVACPSCDANPTAIIATAQHVYIQLSTYSPIRSLYSGNDDKEWRAGTSLQHSGIGLRSLGLSPISFAVTLQEQFLYCYTSSTNGSVADTVAIYALNFSTSSATLIQVMPVQGVLSFWVQSSGNPECM